MGAVIVLGWSGSAALGYVVGNGKGRATEGLLLGLFLGLIGVVIIVCLRPKAQVGFQAAPGSYGATSVPYGERPPAFWAADPYGRHELRWWNGTVWTQQVSDNGFQSVDSVGVGPPPPPVTFR